MYITQPIKLDLNLILAIDVTNTNYYYSSNAIKVGATKIIATWRLPTNPLSVFSLAYDDFSKRFMFYIVRKIGKCIW